MKRCQINPRSYNSRNPYLYIKREKDRRRNKLKEYSDRKPQLRNILTQTYTLAYIPKRLE
jgi:hypothetical protein